MIEVMTDAREGSAPQGHDKFDRELRQWFQRNPRAQTATLPLLIVVKVEDRATLVRENAAASESAFAGRVADLLGWLRTHRASQITLFWINGTIGASLPAEAIAGLAGRDDVEQIQLVVTRRAI